MTVSDSDTGPGDLKKLKSGGNPCEIRCNAQEIPVIHSLGEGEKLFKGTSGDDHPGTLR